MLSKAHNMHCCRVASAGTSGSLMHRRSAPTRHVPGKYCSWASRKSVLSQAELHQGEPTSNAATETENLKDAQQDATPQPGPVTFTALDLQHLLAQYQMDPPQELIDRQIAHLIDPHLEDIGEVVQQLPLIRAELGDQQALLAACNQFLEDMAGRHLDLLLQQQAARDKEASPDGTAAVQTGQVEAQAVDHHQQQLLDVTGQLESLRQHADDLLQQKDALNKQLRIVTMEREELKEQVHAAADASISSEMQHTLQQLSATQDKLSSTEEELNKALSENMELTKQLQEAQCAVEAAKDAALAATSSASAATHAQLQEKTAKVAALEAQVAATQQHGVAVLDSNKVLQKQLQQAHQQGGRLIALNKQLMQHAEKLEEEHRQQGQVVAKLRADKAVMAAELGRIYVMLQEMQSAHQRQQHLQQQLLQVISQQQLHDTIKAAMHTAPSSAEGSDDNAAVAVVAAPHEHTADTTAAAGGTTGAKKQEGKGGFFRILSGAVIGVTLPIVGLFLR